MKISFGKTLSNTEVIKKEESLNLAAISFIENGKELNIIDNAVISNEDLYQEKDNELDK